jgi:magnesium transporter
MVDRGEDNDGEMIIDCAVYEDGRRKSQVALRKAYAVGELKDAFVWIGLHEPTSEEFEAVRHQFHLHELAVEDAIKAHQRPKLEQYGDSLFVVLKTARYIEANETVDFGEIMLFVGARFVVVVRHGQASELSRVRRDLESRPELLRCGPSAVLLAIVDQVVDDYIPVVQGVDNDVQEVEQQVFSDDRANPVKRIYKLKRVVLEFHRATASLLEPLDRLARRPLDLINPDLVPYLRDVHDHLVRVNDRVDTFREVLTSALEANLTQLSVRQNEDMRRISALVAIAAVPTLIAGIYGMNFQVFPELSWAFGYPFVLSLMGLCCFTLYRAFRRSGWL